MSRTLIDEIIAFDLFTLCFLCWRCNPLLLSVYCCNLYGSERALPRTAVADKLKYIGKTQCVCYRSVSTRS